MGKPSFVRNNWIHSFSWTTKYALLVVLAGTLLGCGKGKSGPSATGTFCNDLVLTGQIHFVGYLNFTGDGVNTTWYANSGECTPCLSMPAGESLSFEFGDEDDWIHRFTKTLNVDGEYKFKAEIDDADGLPGITVYVPKTGYHCEDINVL